MRREVIPSWLMDMKPYLRTLAMSWRNMLDMRILAFLR